MFGWLFRKSRLVEVVCLANSRKYGGRCFAGLLLDGSGWLRPVSRDRASHGALKNAAMRLPDGTEPKLLDTVVFKVSAPRPLGYQMENWELAGGQWTRSTYEVSPDFLHAQLVKGPALLGGTDDREPLGRFNSKEPGPSLALISPDRNEVSWERHKTSLGQRQVRAAFRLSRQPYNLVVTDPEWESRVPLGEGAYSSEELGVASGTSILLTVSLGEPLEEYCYKLVAGVILFSG